MRVLVIEDDALNLKLTRTVLESGGHEVTFATTVADGLAEIRRLPPDVVIMDVHLPDMEGFSAIRDLKEDAGLGKIPVIAVTALAMKGDRERILRAGFDYYVSKPIRYREVLELIETAVKSHGDQSEG